MELNAALDFARNLRNGVLVTTRRDGRPQLSNITFVVEENGLIAISVTASRAKTANARRDPRVSMHVTAPDFWAYIVIDGQAELTAAAVEPQDDTVEQLVSYYRTLRGEHPDWDEYRSAMVSEARLMLRIRPERAYGILR